MANLIEAPKFDFDISEQVTRSGGGWQLAETVTNPYAWADVFTAEECKSIIEIGKRAKVFKATTVGVRNDSRRDSTVAFLFPQAATDWLYRRLADAILSTNQHFGFDLTHMVEGIQFTEYCAPGQKYGWHVDAGPRMSCRKLSLTVQLTDPDGYDGGDVQLNPDGNIITIDKVQGRVCAFPSWTLHQVTPVTRGTRHSLVVWVTGPPFR